MGRTAVWGMVLVVLLLPVTAWAESGRNGNPVRDYAIGAGDVIEISVWKDPDLTKLVTVRPDGKITFPLVGQIHVEGKTVDTIKAELIEKITRYVSKPIISVDVRQLNSLVIYVVGKANRPGRFVFTGEINVMQALAMAGGVNAFAKKSRIKIFRNGAGGGRVVDFDYDKAASGDNPGMNIPLMRGDLIVVP